MPSARTPESPAQSAIDIHPLSVHIGAEIHGVDIREPLSPQAVDAIHHALLEWKVVFFRDQPLDHQQHSRFARYFGECTPAHVVFGASDELFPEIYSIAKYRTANQHQGEPLLRAWSEWHTDITAAVNPPFASILRGVVVPPYGGDTQWVNMAAVYQSLSPTLREVLQRLRCVHRFDAPEGAEMSETFRDKLEENNLLAEHPMVTIHPESGEHVLYVNPGFVEAVVGMKPHESQALLQMLYEQCIRPEYMVRFKWEPGSVAFWDNRASMHLAPADIFDVDFDRQFYRITLMGEPQTGLDGSQSKLISGRPIAAL